MEPVGPDGQTSYFKGQTSPRAVLGFFYDQKFSWTFVKTLAMEPIGPYYQTGPFSRSNEPRAGKPPFCQFLCAIIHAIFGDSEFRRDFCQKIS
ncbi:hypothetical protein H5410_012938 [Solanum commersonii]|uniref:Uncharacterized protein n=1 Tax=Solanum commersonii TaxID=4109 RepID=A0A9J6AT38_SOLCO|nr:hypothetical protein H5410_012938 [Solanum commersonii]